MFQTQTLKRAPGSEVPGRSSHKRTLGGVSFSGRVTALMGPSGAGKSTILNLLLGLNTPSAGRIEVGEHDLSELDRPSWVARMAITGQDIELLRGTILENLRLDRPDVREAEGRHDQDLAGVLAFGDTLPEGLDTIVADRDLRLFGGQLQRIALARAIPTRPGLLILDEASNAVEAGLEEDTHLRAAPPDLTVVVVAHRSTALANADQVIEIQDGAFVRIAVSAAPSVLAS